MRSRIYILSAVLLFAGTRAVEAQFTYTTNADDTLTITGYSGPPGTVTIPTNLNGLAVTSIGDYAFEWNTNLISLTVPESITGIGVDAFAGCSGLTSLKIPGSVTNIADYAFLGCDSMTNIVICNGVASIGSGSFGQCSALVSITIPNSVTNIGSGAFQYCHSLGSLVIPASVIRIEDYAFSSCISLTNILFEGNPPVGDLPPSSGVASAFVGTPVTTVYYLTDASDWGWFYGFSTVLWNPSIQTSNGGFGVFSNQFGFIVTGTSNIPIVVEACTNLANPSWTPLTNGTLTNGTFSFSDFQWTNFPARFYGIGFP